MNPISGRRWPLILGAGAAAVTSGILVAVLVVGIRGGAGPTPSARAATSPEQTAAPSPSPTAEPTTSPTASVATEDWQAASIEAPAQADEPHPYYARVEWFEDVGFVAYGADPLRGPRIWQSPDGLDWTAATLPDADLIRFNTVDLAAATIGGRPRLVALLTGVEPASLVLVSEDARQWRLATSPAASEVLTAVAYGSAGFVAIGTARRPAFASPNDGVVWRSSDGLEWTQLASTGLEGSIGYGIGFIESGGGRYVAAGRPDEPGPATWTWTSPDGAAWERHELLPPIGTGSGSLNVGVESDGAILGVVGDDNGPYVAFTQDGVAWTIDRFLPASAGAFTAVDIKAGTVVAVALVPPIDIPPASSLWVRDAGETAWREVAWKDHAPAGFVDSGATGVAIGDKGTLVMFGDGKVLLTNDRIP